MKMQSNRLVLWTCLALLPLRAEDGKRDSVEEWHQHGLYETIMVGSEYVKPQVLRQYYETHFLQQRRFPKLLIITAYATQEDAERISENMTMEVEQRLYDKARHRPPQHISEILAIGPDAVLRNVAGTDISRSVLHGSDPTVFDLGPVHCEILQVNTH